MGSIFFGIYIYIYIKPRRHLFHSSFLFFRDWPIDRSIHWQILFQSTTDRYKSIGSVDILRNLWCIAYLYVWHTYDFMHTYKQQRRWPQLHIPTPRLVIWNTKVGTKMNRKRNNQTFHFICIKLHLWHSKKEKKCSHISSKCNSTIPSFEVSNVRRDTLEKWIPKA